MNVQESIEAVRARMKGAAKSAGRGADEIELIAVTKKIDTERMKIAINCGVKSFGESYAQELIIKLDEIKNVKWHFIGQLQTNKVKYISRELYMLHSLDRISLAKELNKHLMLTEAKLKVLVQINISKELQKGGIFPDDTERFLNELMRFEKLDVCGLMCIPAVENDINNTTKDFAAVKRIYDKMKSIGFNMRFLSMGMSNDFEEAIKEGANLVRVGSAIFGLRA